MWLFALHAVMAALATLRLTELVVLDRITAPIRARGGYLLTCVRCVSVWAGVAATLCFVFVPWLNWPLALSWCVIASRDWRQAVRRRVLQRKDVTDRIAELLRDRTAAKEAIEQTQAALQQQAQHLTRVEGAILELQEMLKSPLLAESTNGAGPHPVEVV